jgi:serine/threonine protein kinase
LYNSNTGSLNFHGITRDPKTKEFMMVMQYASQGSLRCVLSSNFNNILWEEKLLNLMNSAYDLKNLHELGYIHKDFHSGNILLNCEDNENISYISDFGFSVGPSNKQKSDDKICGVLPYIAPEVLNNKTYASSSDIYSFGVIMTELSSGMPPFYKRDHDVSLALEICNGLRPEFGKGTPEIYKKLAHQCMNANPDKRPTANELYNILSFWHNSTYGNCQDIEKFGHKGKEIRAIFKEADKEISNISTSYEKHPGAIYISRAFPFNDLPKPINSSSINSYLQDSLAKYLSI